MPTFTPPLKVIATKGYGAEVILAGDSFDEALAAAQAYQLETGATFVHPFDDEHIISGQGTVAIEMLQDLENIDIIFVPIGGGGLISGIAAYVKQLRPDIKIIGVEAKGSESMFKSVQAGALECLDKVSTIADGIAVKKPGEMTFNIVRQYVDEIVVVNDAEIAEACYMLLQRGKLLAEPSGTAALAAILKHKVDVTDKNVVAVVSGGNIKMGLLQQILEKGLMNEGLRSKVSVMVPDVAGVLKEITTILSDLSVSVHEIIHERTSEDVPVGYVKVILTFHLPEPDKMHDLSHEFNQRGFEYTILN